MSGCIRILPIAVFGLVASATLGTAHQPSDQPEGPALLHVQQHEEHGPYLVDQKGMAVYLFEIDVQGKDGVPARSNCYDECATAWPPLVTEGEPQAHDDASAELIGTLTREDGESQVTYNGWPLYYFSADQSPGHTRGHDIEANGGEWYLVAPAGEAAGEEH